MDLNFIHRPKKENETSYKNSLIFMNNDYPVYGTLVQTLSIVLSP